MRVCLLAFIAASLVPWHVGAEEIQAIVNVKDKDLRKKLAAPTVVYKQGELTLGYDFRHRGQLKDFDTAKAPRVECDRGALRLAPGNELSHKAQFLSCKASVVVTFQKVGVPFLKAGPLELRYEGGWRNREFEVKTPTGAARTRAMPFVPEKEMDATRRYFVSLLVDQGLSTLSVTGGGECAVNVAPQAAFDIAFDGGTNGLTIEKFELKGEPDPAWLKDLLR